MGALFGALDTAATGATVSRVWMDTISDNVANVNTIRPADEEPFRSRLVVARSFESAKLSGARVVSITEHDGDPAMAYDPTNPLADEEGYIKMPVVELAEEMTNMLLANRTYQANLAVMDRVRDAYQSALTIGAR